MSAKTELKLAISVDMMEQYYREGGGKYGGELKKLGIKFADFTFKGTFEVKEADLTEKKVLADFLRAGKGIIVQFSMGVDSDVEDVLKKNKVDTKNKKAVAAALGDADDKLKKDMRLEVEAAHKRMRSLMEDVVKEYSGKKEGVDFKNEAQVARLLKSLKSLPNLRRDYKSFKTVLDAAGKSTRPGTQGTVVAKAYEAFINSDGVKLIESARKIPKVEPAKPDKDDKAEKAKASAVNDMAEALIGLRKEIVILADELEALRAAYTNLQDLLAGHTDGGTVGKSDPAAKKKQEAELAKAFDTFPEISEAHVKKVLDSLDEAEKGLSTFKKAAA